MDGYSIRESWFSLEWSPDGSMLFGLTESAYLFLWETGAYSLLYNQNVGNNPTARTWLPDGSAITNGQSIFDVATLQMHYGVRYLQFGNPSVGILTAIGFSPNGQLLAIGDNYGSAFLLDADTYELIVSVANPEPLDQRTPIYSLGWAADSSQVMFTGWNSVYTLELSGRLERLADAEGNLYAGDWGVTGSIAAGGLSSDGYGLFGMTATTGEVGVQSASEMTLTFERVDPP
jgi:WD40 repeat protein